VRDVDFVGQQEGDRETCRRRSTQARERLQPRRRAARRRRLRDYYEDEGYFEVQITPTSDKFRDGDVR
jgi:outer membrane protein assembly factor BamA